MIGKIGRSTTQFLTFGKYIPEDFSESYYIPETLPLPLPVMEG
jgi:hypothetical protein